MFYPLRSFRKRLQGFVHHFLNHRLKNLINAEFQSLRGYVETSIHALILVSPVLALRNSKVADTEADA